MKRFARAYLSWLIFAGALGGCVNFAGPAHDKANEFLRLYPGHLVETKVGNRSLRYAWVGDPKLAPLLFVHGSPGGWEGWADFLFDESLRAKFQIIVVDRPGYGGTDGGITERSLDRQADLIMEALKINQSDRAVILVGHSYGGPVVAKMAIRYPKRIGGVVFVASSVDPDLEKTKWYQYPASWWPIRAMIPSHLRVCNEEIFALKTELETMRQQWRFFQAKTVLIQGQADPLVAPENFDFLQKYIEPQLVVRATLVPDLNHFVPWIRPDLIKDGILELEKYVLTAERH